MIQAVDNISISGVLWLRVQHHLISFRLNDMQEDVHFSIAYNTNSPDVNFHLTRNTIDSSNKPKIEIARINKNELEEVSYGLFASILNLILQPVIFRSYRRKSKHSRYGILYLPLHQWGNENSIVQTRLAHAFKSISKVKNNRLKINGGIEKCIASIAGEVNIHNSFQESLRWLPRKFSQQAVSGFIISRKFTGCAVNINNRWYCFRQNIKPLDFLFTWLNPALARHLAFKTIMAYARIRHLTSWEQSEKHNCPVRL